MQRERHKQQRNAKQRNDAYFPQRAAWGLCIRTGDLKSLLHPPLPLDTHTDCFHHQQVPELLPRVPNRLPHCRRHNEVHLDALLQVDSLQEAQGCSGEGVPAAGASDSSTSACQCCYGSCFAFAMDGGNAALPGCQEGSQAGSREQGGAVLKHCVPFPPLFGPLQALSLQRQKHKAVPGASRSQAGPNPGNPPFLGRKSRSPWGSFDDLKAPLPSIFRQGRPSMSARSSTGGDGSGKMGRDGSHVIGGLVLDMPAGQREISASNNDAVEAWKSLSVNLPATRLAPKACSHVVRGRGR